MSRDVNNRKPKRFLSQLFLVFVIMAFLMAEGIVGILIFKSHTAPPAIEVLCHRHFLRFDPCLNLVGCLALLNQQSHREDGERSGACHRLEQRLQFFPLAVAYKR